MHEKWFDLYLKKNIRDLAQNLHINKATYVNWYSYRLYSLKCIIFQCLYKLIEISKHGQLADGPDTKDISLRAIWNLHRKRYYW